MLKKLVILYFILFMRQNDTQKTYLAEFRQRRNRLKEMK